LRLAGFFFAALQHIHNLVTTIGGADCLTATVSLSVSQEHRFWLDILQDHARFLLDHLSPHEKVWIEEADKYVHVFNCLLRKLDDLPASSNASSKLWIAYAKEAHTAAAGYYQLEGRLQALLIAEQVELSMSPALLNGTLTENQEYLRMLQYYVQGAEAPALSLWSLMDLWLDDQLGHAELIQELLAPLSLQHAVEAGSLAEEFRSHLLSNKAIQGYLRFTPPGFSGQLNLARDAAASVVRLFLLVEETVSLLRPLPHLEASLLRLVEHHLPEASYFMTKLSYWIPDTPGLIINRLGRYKDID
jgi:hypothetical protein